MSKIIAYIIVGAVLTVVIFVGIMAFGFGVSITELPARFINLFSTTPSNAQVISSRTLLNSLQPLGQLVSVRADVAKADIFVGVQTGGLNLCGHSAQHVAQGVIEAGIDFTAFTESDLLYNAETDTYTVTLPAPAITSCRIEYIRQYERNGGAVTCDADWDNVRLLAQFVALDEFVDDTLSGGLLDRAETETTILMRNFIEALTGSDVEIIIASPTDTTIPSSCIAQTPRGWAFDEAVNAWVFTD